MNLGQSRGSSVQQPTGKRSDLVCQEHFRTHQPGPSRGPFPHPGLLRRRERGSRVGPRAVAGRFESRAPRYGYLRIAQILNEPVPASSAQKISLGACLDGGVFRFSTARFLLIIPGWITTIYLWLIYSGGLRSVSRLGGISGSIQSHLEMSGSPRQVFDFVYN